ncbi:glycosyltransferase family 2 [Fadolivirus algeromassiliense]|jgi:hypothetical protein|uniref:Glycosyltransferase family 2 n=1 Tax=Fadolivirus FV1/VV64 TaxID=3070911 RepID=A0A7D3UTL7_9VIRU|nr:glycosyltransferase family 2 [Fadolivirus algeromassiliense]QKF94410.1 glycosyltransferase family 2 [Fadolivirus FV1/VV64]
MDYKKYEYKYYKYKSKYTQLKQNKLNNRQYGGNISEELYKKYMIDNEKSIKHTKSIVDNLDKNYMNHITINSKLLDNNTISIIMTTYNRPKQTYHTLDTISRSSYKNVQIVIVDDSEQPSLDIETLKRYNMHIDYVTIKNKFWINPCINYNIGFKIAKGTKIIIQNSEVCHVGDIVTYVNDNLKQNQYLVFNVLALLNESYNNNLYISKDINLYVNELINKNEIQWYQHPKYRNKNYHFLTAINKLDLDKLNGFDYDFSMGYAYDDDELIYRVTNVLKLDIINVDSNETKLYGIHQWHSRNYVSNLREPLIGINKILHDKKIKYYKSTNNYVMMYGYDTIKYIEILRNIFGMR